MKEKYIESLFGIELFSYDQVSMYEDGMQYTNVEFFFDSMKEFNGMCLEVSWDWNLAVWTNDGQKVKELSLIDIPEFREKLKAKL